MAESTMRIEQHPDAGDTEEQWMATALFGQEPSAAPTAVISRADDAGFLHDDPDDDTDETRPDDARSDEADGAADDGDLEPVDLDAPAEGELEEPTAAFLGAADANAGSKKTALVLGAGLVVAIVAIVGAFVMFSSPDTPASPDTATPTAAAPAPSAAPTSAPPAPPDQDQAVPFTASANCPPGSTSAQALTDTASDSAWVCVRGAPGGQVDGQVLHIDLGRSYVLSAVSITPGWVAKTPGGKDEWLAHRVVTRLQYIFNDDDRHHLHPGHRQHPRPGDHAATQEGAGLTGHRDHPADLAPAGITGTHRRRRGTGPTRFPRLGAGPGQRPDPCRLDADQPARSRPDGPEPDRSGGLDVRGQCDEVLRPSTDLRYHR